ncbi:MAG: tripartite tricarboxylate transporter substrate binding protein [Proteobacteria bacterium]|jgi:tripartite-type tricarboxylate transporter receptor subunit TctC|nr:tripartite tricarboxylate transporter substrate binding protein [Pseudomonadota bacterium]
MKIITRLVLSAVVCAGICPAHAQTYPAKPVRFIVPFPPGGPTDIMGRMAAQRLTEAWGVQVVADNRGGAGGNIGSELCAKSPPDGYTICMLTVAQSMSPGIYPRLPFDPLKDFAPVTLMATLPSLLMAHPSLPVKNVKELVALAKAKPGMLTYASTGNGTSPHMLMEMFKWMAGVNLVHVPYKGAAPAMIDQISGQIDVAFSTAIAALPFVQQGKVRALAISTQERFPPMPDLPTVEQGGVKGFDGSSWQGVVMPANTPREFVLKANAELAKMLKSPEMKEKILQQGGIASGNSPEEFAAFIKSETEKWSKVAKAAKVRIE